MLASLEQPSDGGEGGFRGRTIALVPRRRRLLGEQCRQFCSDRLCHRGAGNGEQHQQRPQAQSNAYARLPLMSERRWRSSSPRHTQAPSRGLRFLPLRRCESLVLHDLIARYYRRARRRERTEPGASRRCAVSWNHAYFTVTFTASRRTYCTGLPCRVAG
jgi:hypothetical protein